MADTTPPSNDIDQTAHYASSTSAQDISANADEEGGMVFYLVSPPPASNIERAAAVALRKRLRWSEGSPPGIYWQGDVDPYHPFVFKDYPQDDSQDNSSESPAGLLTPLGTTGQDTQSTTSEEPDSSDSDSETPGPSPVTPPANSNFSDVLPHFATPASSGSGLYGDVKHRSATFNSQFQRPEISQGQLAELGYSNLITVRRQVYLLELIIQQRESPGKDAVAEDQLFHMLIDTASNVTWVLGEDYCKANVTEVDNEVTHIKLSNWPPGEGATGRHSTLKPNPFRRNLGTRGKHLKAPFPPFTQYADSTVALVSQLVEPRIFTVNNFYFWDRTRWTASKWFQYRFAVAYAIDENASEDYSDGMLGLGTLRRQAIFDPYEAERDFSSVLIDQCVRPFSTQAGDFHYPGGYAFLFALRPPHLEYRSWMAVHTWPTSRKPDFSESIPVKKTAYQGTWAIECQRMTFYVIDAQTGARNTIASFSFQTDRDSGILFIVDTGASISYVPFSVIKELRALFSPAAHSGEFPFRVPAHIRQDDLRVEFLFRGKDDWVAACETQVSVTGPAVPFLCQASDGAGLLFSGPDDLCVLGLNFFQIMYVGMYHPRQNDETVPPFIKLAAQWPAEIPDFDMPPKREENTDTDTDTGSEGHLGEDETDDSGDDDDEESEEEIDA